MPSSLLVALALAGMRPTPRSVTRGSGARRRKGYKFEPKITANPGHGHGHGGPRSAMYLGSFETNLEAALARDVGNLWRQLHHPGGGQLAGGCLHALQARGDAVHLA